LACTSTYLKVAKSSTFDNTAVTLFVTFQLAGVSDAVNVNHTEYIRISRILIVVFFTCCTGIRHNTVDHMQHLPEELGHLRQRACPSASQDSKTPLMWQRCPGKRQLGCSIPCFSDYTVQYVIDCNRSSASADKDAADNLSSGNTSPVIGSSRPRKRPHLDEVDFFTVVFLEFVHNLSSVTVVALLITWHIKLLSSSLCSMLCLQVIFL